MANSHLNYPKMNVLWKHVTRGRSMIGISLLIVQLLLAGCGRQDSQAESGRLKVVSTVSPLTNIVYNIGGDRIEIEGIVPEGINSHTFEPAPSDAVKLAEADLIFMNGLNLELPTLELAKANLKQGAEIVLLGERTLNPDEYVYDFSFPKEAGNPNPHLWTNPLHALAYAEIVASVLAEHDPENADYYAGNYSEYAARIEALDQAIQATTASIPAGNRMLLTYHDSFAYFAPRYGYTIIGAIQPADFSEPSAREVAALIDQVRELEVPAVFGSAVFPSPVLDQIGREAGVEFIDTLRDDDLPGEVGESDHSYIGLMVANLKIMAGALGGDPSLMDGVDASNLHGSN
jgi:ABC-type Zn uptake system ZnuABC Zn-binding protein ZnuA